MTTLLWLAMLPAPFVLPLDGELIAWSRILDDEEALCVVNGMARNCGAERSWLTQY